LRKRRHHSKAEPRLDPTRPQDAVNFQPPDKFTRREIAEDCNHDASGSGIIGEFIGPQPEGGRKLNTALGWSVRTPSASAASVASAKLCETAAWPRSAPARAARRRVGG
jgi:hypothetical protein